MIVLDTTILLYAVGMEHPLREPCRAVLLAHQSGLLQAATTLEVIQEFAHVRSRRRSRASAVNLARDYLKALQIISIERDDLELGLDYYERHSRLGSFDCVLAAVAVRRRARALISADRAFASVPELPWIDVATMDIHALIENMR